MTPILATLLLVEDEPAIRQLMARALQAEGYRVLEARTGKEAAALYDHHGADIDLLITDVHLPYLSGTELAIELRKHRRTLDVLYVTGFPDDRTSNGHRLVKPFRRDALIAAVRRILAGRAEASSALPALAQADGQPPEADPPATAV